MKKLIVSLASVIALQAGVASAAIISLPDQRNFEGGTDGLPFNPGVYDINSPSAVIEADGSAKSTYALNGNTTHTNTNGILLTNSSATDTPQSGATFTPFLSNTAIPYYVQFDYKSLEDSPNAGFFIQGDSGRAVNIHMSAGASNFVQVNQGGGFGDISGMDLNIGEWYRFTLTIDPLSAAMDTFDLRVQSLDSGSLDVTANSLGFQNDTGELRTFRFHYNLPGSATGGQYAIDNVRWTDDSGDLVFDAPIAIPEPSTVMLAGLSLVGLCVRLRRRR